MDNKLQYDGTPLPEKENPNDIIRVWKVSPNPYTSECDTWVGRDLEDAETTAQEVISYIFDNLELGEERSATIKLTAMKLRDYIELMSETE